MTGMSLLRPCARQGLRLALTNGKPTQVTVNKKMQILGQVSVRNGGHEQRMAIEPTRFEWKRFKDDLHFYLMLGLVPMIALITYVNLFIGPAELSDIPEGYEPKEWEYFQSPIKRWFAKYVYEEPQKEYERTLHFLHIRGQERYWKQIDKKVKILMQDRQDYKGWYWVAPDKSILDDETKAREVDAKRIGTS